MPNPRRLPICAATAAPEYGIEVCRRCDAVKADQIAELENPRACPQCGLLLYGLLGTEIIDPATAAERGGE